MNEDEAFIRAIVDNPGDDLPRLVYADWLDDRGDPRGPYLREELAVLNELRNEELSLPIDVTDKLAVGLDPVWVARVSRPPVGVCCDRVRFTNCGPLLNRADVEQVERRLHGAFSADFRAFLLNYNGGQPSFACLPYPDRADPAWADMDLEVGRFYTASRPAELPPPDAGELWNFEIEREREWLEELSRVDSGDGANELIAEMAPFADTMHDLGYFLIGIGETNRGRIYHFRDYCHFSNDPDHLFDYAATFGDFLARLRPGRDTGD